MRAQLDAYVRALTSGKIDSGEADGLCGRILHGQFPGDFLNLTNEPDRKLIMLMGSDGLAKLVGKTGCEVLVEIGYTEPYLQELVKQGHQFKLVVLPADLSAKVATWDNVIEIVAATYPLVAQQLHDALPALKSTTFAELEQKAGFGFEEVSRHREDPRFMTAERLQASYGSPPFVRAFLYHTVHLRKLFSGDGYTYTQDGRRGLTEYIVPNKAIADIGDHVLMDIEVKIPQSAVTTKSF